MVNSGVQHSKVVKTVAITDKKSYSYNWLTSNPLGFGDWFLEVSNQHLTTDMKSEQYNNLPNDIEWCLQVQKKYLLIIGQILQEAVSLSRGTGIFTMIGANLKSSAIINSCISFSSRWRKR